MLHRSALLFSLLFSFVSSVSSITFQWEHFFLMFKDLEFLGNDEAKNMQTIATILWDNLKSAYEENFKAGKLTDELLVRSLLEEILGNMIYEQLSNPGYAEQWLDCFKQYFQIPTEKRFNANESKAYRSFFRAMNKLYYELFNENTFDREFSNCSVETINFFYKFFNAFFVLQAAVFPYVEKDKGKRFVLTALESKTAVKENDVLEGILKQVKENYINHMTSEFYLKHISPIIRDVYNGLFKDLKKYENIDFVTRIENFLANPWDPASAEEFEQTPLSGSLLNNSWMGIAKRPIENESGNLTSSSLGINPTSVLDRDEESIIYLNPEKCEVEDQAQPSLEYKKGALVKPVSTTLDSTREQSQKIASWMSIEREAEVKKREEEPKGLAHAVSLINSKSKEDTREDRKAPKKDNPPPNSQKVISVKKTSNPLPKKCGLEKDRQLSQGKRNTPEKRKLGLAEILHTQEKVFNAEKYVNEISSFIIQSVDGGAGMSDLHRDAKMLSEKCITAGKIYRQTADLLVLIDLFTQCGHISKEELTQDSVATYLNDTSLDRYFEKQLDEEYTTTRELAQKIWAKVCKAEVYKDKKWNDETIKSLIQDPYLGKPRTQDPSSFIERLKNKKKKKRIARVENRLGIKETPKLLTAVVQKNEDSPRSARWGAIVPVQSFEKWRADEYKQYKQINIMLPKTINTADREALKIWAKEIEEYKKQSAPHEPKKSKFKFNLGSIGRLFSWLFSAKKS